MKQGKSLQNNRRNSFLLFNSQIVDIQICVNTTAEGRLSNSPYSGMEEMVSSLVGADKAALKQLFWCLFRIIAVDKTPEAVYALVKIYTTQFGFTDQECSTIISEKTGRQVNY